MVDNFDAVAQILKFDSEDDFYHCQILKRKKEHPELGSNSYVVKTYYIRDLWYLMYRKEEMIAIAKYHNARVCINLNRRSFEKIAFHTLRKVTDIIMNKDYKSVRKAYESVCGAHSAEKDKKWIIDVDKPFLAQDLMSVKEAIKNCQPNPGEDKMISIIPTKNGYHLITSPFNIQEAKLGYDIHKDNPTILYIP